MVSSQEQLPLDDLFVANGEDEAELHVDLDPTLLAPSKGSDVGDDLVSRRGSDPQNLDSEAIPLLRPDGESFENALVAALLAIDAMLRKYAVLINPTAITAPKEYTADDAAAFTGRGTESR